MRNLWILFLGFCCPLANAQLVPVVYDETGQRIGTLIGMTQPEIAFPDRSLFVGADDGVVLSIAVDTGMLNLGRPNRIHFLDSTCSGQAYVGVRSRGGLLQHRGVLFWANFEPITKGVRVLSSLDSDGVCSPPLGNTTSDLVPIDSKAPTLYGLSVIGGFGSAFEFSTGENLSIRMQSSQSQQGTLFCNGFENCPANTVDR